MQLFFYLPHHLARHLIWLVRRASVLIHCGEIGSRNGLKRHGKEDSKLILHTKRWVTLTMGRGKKKGNACSCHTCMYRLRIILANAPSNLRIQLRLSRSRVLVKVLSSGWNDVLKSIVRRMVYQCLKILSLVSPIWQHYMYACMEYSHFVYREAQE